MSKGTFDARASHLMYLTKPLITFDSSQKCITFDSKQKWPLTRVKSDQRYGQIWPLTPLTYGKGVV